MAVNQVHEGMWGTGGEQRFVKVGGVGVLHIKICLELLLTNDRAMDRDNRTTVKWFSGYRGFESNEKAHSEPLTANLTIDSSCVSSTILEKSRPT